MTLVSLGTYSQHVHHLIFKGKVKNVFDGNVRDCWKNYYVFCVWIKAFRKRGNKKIKEKDKDT